ncbi:adenylate/guanylate cyclase domain-containing protein [Accumulibacter sp.]|jgi:adenylate cyclase|uniref:adenylate/guanylate cyclase domain-containing protein n=1 Tax=Accumulibacter sp. TaxID=2053492 RepID=UPI0012C126C9|nr:adenylate/guanylate cyclase domain-containing protein [Accumulibacter sp.]MBN8514068.1 adenylate/guanylate cyclase domain-containing protein [Accumulibacter sp.]MBO3703257.1 adenylate/guanylate cyclase domain-containing protein [Accumulibacter sp.]MQM33425.1 adenylate/guanylate cyclase domain-containing protein [Candidatus Accumulibacter phosphatis]HRI91312.1 adenylate/guanylate cyclase domain-containing protein [Accumulibacter sp.]
MMAARTFIDRLRNAGICAGDSEELRLQKSLLFFATGLISLASMVWLSIYWQLGPRFSSNLPFALQLLLVGNLLIYLKTLNFNAFRLIQLSLFLFTPFVAQWTIGSFITASGISLWALLAPIGAVLFIGPRESGAWFFAYVFLTTLSGAFDYYLADSASAPPYEVPAATTAFFFALNFTAVSSIVYLLLRYSDSEKHRAQQHLQETHRLLQVEQERSERLLLNILPAPIAERLKNSSQPIADGFAEVSVMFADIVNFTRVAEGMAPQQVFAMLNKIFSCFDELAEKYGLEKIKTIGDAYMVAGGLNDARSDFSGALAEMALEMCRLLHDDLQLNEMRLELRIGIGTGPVVAGVVGKKKFIYDLWGDTVNIASRVTSEGAPGVVQVDERTYRRLQQRFEFHQAQTIYLKGKGNMVVHRLIGHRTGSTVAAPRA